MQRIRSRLGDHADLSARALAVLGAVRIREHVEFAHGVDPQQIAADAARRDGELAGSGVFDPIQQHHVFHGTPSRHRERISIAGAGGGTLQNVVDDSRIERHQIVEAAAVERQFFYLALIHQSGNGGGRGVDQGRVGGHGDFFGNGADFQAQIGNGLLSHRQVDSQADGRFESGFSPRTSCWPTGTETIL